MIFLKSYSLYHLDFKMVLVLYPLKNIRHLFFKTNKLKQTLIYLFAISIFSACEPDGYQNSIVGFQEIEKDLIEKFGIKSYYTDLSIVQNEHNKLEIKLLVTSNPHSYAMDGWNYKDGDWQKVSEVGLELDKGNIENYLYDLNKEVNIIKVGYLVSICIERAKEKGLKNPILDKIVITSPDDGNKSKMKYAIYLISDTKKINYLYSLEGDLIDQFIH